ncbi:MAG: hypothetical protein J7J80_05325 [Thermotogae bacterium]|nr:hypothetical protein [Thermotogota bacterium]
MKSFHKVLVPRTVGIIVSLAAMGVIIGFGFVPKALTQWRALSEFKLVATELQRIATENERLKGEFAKLNDFLKNYRELEYSGITHEEGEISWEFKNDDPLLMKIVSDMVNNRRYKLEELKLTNSLLTPFGFADTNFAVKLQLRYSKLVVP